MRKAQYVWKPEKKAPESVQTLLYTDIQKFLKRLRKAYRGKLRYFVAGEVSSLHGEIAHGLVVLAHEYSHLVDESSCTSGTVAVHAQLHVPPIEKHDLCIFPADVYQRLCLWIATFGKDGGCYDFLDEWSL